MAERKRRAEDHLAQADARLAESRSIWQPELATQARRQAAEVSVEFDSLVEEWQRQLERHRGQSLRSELHAPATVGRRLLKEAMARAPTLALQASVTRVGALLDRVDDAKATTTDLQDLTQQLPAAVADLQALLEVSRQNVEVAEIPSREIHPEQPSPSPEPTSPKAGIRPPAIESKATPPDWLMAAAQAYFKGQYRITLELLDQDDPPREQLFHIHLFRGAARYSIFLLGEEDEAALRETASEDFRECRRHNPSYHPTPNHFSPRLIQFYESQKP